MLKRKLRNCRGLERAASRLREARSSSGVMPEAGLVSASAFDNRAKARTAATDIAIFFNSGFASANPGIFFNSGFAGANPGTLAKRIILKRCILFSIKTILLQTKNANFSLHVYGFTRRHSCVHLGTFRRQS